MQALTLNWPGGEHRFALRLGELRALQDSCQSGPEEVFNRLDAGQWRVNDILEPVRLGLIGGGMAREEAGPLVTALADQHALFGFKMLALEVLFRALAGPEDDQPEKSAGVTTPAPENGASLASTGTAP